MTRESAFLMVFLIILVGGSSTAPGVQRVKASGTIYIRADGSIDPPDAPISTVDNVTYTLTGNIISDAHGIFLQRSNMTLDGAGFTLLGTQNGTGIYMNGMSNVTVIDTTVNNFTFGFSLGDSFLNNIMANNITNNSYGILGSGSWFNSLGNNITANNITANNEGIDFAKSSNNNITANKIMANSDIAILLTFSSDHNSISQNNIANNGKGIWLHESSSNSIVTNNFANNTQQVYVEKSGYTNFWNNSYPSGGNYWSDYTGVDANHDGIGDTAYVIDTNNTDNHPLMGMFSSYNVTYYTPPIVPYACNVTVISNSTISDFVAPIWIEHPEVIVLQFNVSGAEGSTGFCRVSFPTAMMNGTYHVSVNGTEIPYTLLPFSDANYSYLYFTYTHSTETIIIIPEFPSFLILPLFFMATLLAVTVYRRKHFYSTGK